MGRSSTQPRAAAQEGFTLVEVMIAALLVTVGIIALMGSLDAVSKTALVAQRHQQALAYGQREIERLRTMDYTTELGMTSLPSATGDGITSGDATPSTPKNPNYYVSGTGLKIMASYANKNSGLQTGVVTNPEPFVGPSETSLSNAQVNPGPESFSINGTSGKIYRYVTWRAESCPSSTTSGITSPCPGAKQSKRITIAITVDAVGNNAGPGKPIWLSSIVADPNATPTGVAPPGTPVTSTASVQNFFLTDTPCSTATRQPIVASHATHATSTSATPSCSSASTAADYMDIDTTEDAPTVPVYDYSNEISRPAPAGLSQAAGLAITKATSGTTDCPTSGAAANVHTWASAPVPSTGFKIPTGGRASLNFLSQTIDGVTGRVTLCAALRDGQTGGVIANTTYDVADWPTSPQQLTFAWDLPVYTVAAGQRLLLTISLKASTSATTPIVIYDHPSYQSFLSVATTTPM